MERAPTSARRDDDAETAPVPARREPPGHIPLAIASAGSVLLVDEAGAERARLERELRAHSIRVATAPTFEGALDLTRRRRFQLVVTELRLGARADLPGLALIRALQRAPGAPAVVILTAYPSLTAAVRAGRLGVVAFLAKPATAVEVLGAGSRAAGRLAQDRISLSLDRAIWEHLTRTLLACDGNLAEAARRLRVPRRSLQRMLDKHAPPDQAAAPRDDRRDRGDPRERRFPTTSPAAG